MNTYVQQQDTGLIVIEQNSHNTVQNTDDRNQNISSAISSAKSACKHKCWCLVVFGLFTVPCNLTSVLLIAF
jgi:t-SNARE complex subunit (syntaxin)